MEQQQEVLIQEAAGSLGVELRPGPKPPRKHRHKKKGPATGDGDGVGKPGTADSSASQDSDPTLPMLTPRTVANMQALVAGVQVKMEEMQVSCGLKKVQFGYCLKHMLIS